MWITSDELNIVDALIPQFYDSTITTNFPCAVVNMAKYQSMLAVVQLTNPSTATIYVQNYAALTPSSAGSAVTLHNGGNYRTSNSTGPTVDTLSARTPLTNTTSIAVTAATTAAYAIIIELKADDCATGKPYVAIAISTSATASTGMSVSYYMRPKYLQLTLPTAIS